MSRPPVQAAATIAVCVALLAIPAAAVATPPHDGPPPAASIGKSAIVFVSDRDSPSADEPVDDVYLMTMPNRRIFRMTEDGGSGGERNPTLSPDGRWLAYVRFSVENGEIVPSATALFRCRVRHERGNFSCDQEQRIAGPVGLQPIGWTPDSRSLVYSGPPTADLDVDLYRISLSGGTPVNLTSEPDDDTFAQNTQPSVSRDGRWIYHTRGTAATGADLYRRHLDGSGGQQLTAAPLNDAGVDVSPDGKYLVFHSNRDGDALGGFDIYTMRADVEGPQNPVINLTDALTAVNGKVSEERRPSWSPDGRQIAFMSYTDPRGGFCLGCNDGEIYAMRADGSHVQNLTANNPATGEEPETPLYGDITPDWGQARHRP